MRNSSQIGSISTCVGAGSWFTHMCFDWRQSSRETIKKKLAWIEPMRYQLVKNSAILLDFQSKIDWSSMKCRLKSRNHCLFHTSVSNFWTAVVTIQTVEIFFNEVQVLAHKNTLIFLFIYIICVFKRPRHRWYIGKKLKIILLLFFEENTNGFSRIYWTFGINYTWFGLCALIDCVRMFVWCTVFGMVFQTPSELCTVFDVVWCGMVWCGVVWCVVFGVYWVWVCCGALYTALRSSSKKSFWNATCFTWTIEHCSTESLLCVFGEKVN